MDKIAQIIFLYLNNSLIKVISFICGVRRKTVGKILNKIVKIIKRNTKIGGRNIIVEIDESKFEKKKYNRAHRVDRVWVLGLVERTAYKMFLISVKDRKADTLNNIILKYLRPDSKIYTDCWRGYNRLSKL